MTIKVVQTWPLKMRLQINGDKLSRNVGNKLATHVRKQWKAGLTGGGAPLPVPLQPVRERKGPMQITGWLLSKVRYSRKYQFVMAHNFVRQTKDANGKLRPISKRANSLYGLTRILISGKWRRTTGAIAARLKSGRVVDRKISGASVRSVVDLYGTESALVNGKKEKFAQIEANRQVKSGECGLVTELQQTYRDGRKGR